MSDQLTLDFGPPPAPSLENFWVGANEAVVHQVKNLADNRQKANIFTALSLWGDAGVGKTHLALGLLEQTKAQGLRANYLTPESPLVQFESTIPVQSSQLTIFDGLDHFDDARQQASFALWVDLYQQKSTVLACLRKAPIALQMAGLRADLASRLSQALVFELKPLSDADKAQALRNKFEQRGLMESSEVVELLLKRLPRSMDTLTWALDSLDQLCLATKKPLSVSLVRQWMKQA